MGNRRESTKVDIEKALKLPHLVKTGQFQFRYLERGVGVFYHQELFLEPVWPHVTRRFPIKSLPFPALK